MNRHGKFALVIGFVLVVIAGAVISTAAVRSRPTVWWTDGGSIREREASAPVREILWKPAVRVAGSHGVTEGERGGVAEPGSPHGASPPASADPAASSAGSVSPTTDEYEPRLSADGTVMVFVRGRPGQNAELFTSRWRPEGWTDASAIAAINTPGDELGPELSSDGKSLYFYSDREGGLGGYDLWVSRAEGGSSEWGTPVNLGPAVNSTSNEYGPALAPDGSKLYFSSNRPRAGETAPRADAWTATIRERRERHDYDLYVSGLGGDVGGEPAAAIPIAELNTGGDEGSPAVSPVGDFLYFASDRGGGRGGYDLYRARLGRNGIGMPENLGAAINSAGNDLDPGLSADGFRIYFSSDRELATGDGSRSADAGNASDEALEYRLWYSGSREVYREREYPRDLGLAALWNTIWPWLLILIGMGLLAYLLYRLLRSEVWRRRFSRLSLLAQCLLVSLMIHAMVASALAAWKVGTGIIEMVQAGGGTQVVLTSSGAAMDGSGGGDIFSQVMGPAGGSTERTMPVLTSISAGAPEERMDAPTLASMPEAMRIAAAPVEAVESIEAGRTESAPRVSQQPVKAPAIASTPAVPESRGADAAQREAEVRTVPAAGSVATLDVRDDAGTVGRTEIQPPLSARMEDRAAPMMEAMTAPMRAETASPASATSAEAVRADERSPVAVPEAAGASGPQREATVDASAAEHREIAASPVSAAIAASDGIAARVVMAPAPAVSDAVEARPIDASVVESSPQSWTNPGSSASAARSVHAESVDSSRAALPRLANVGSAEGQKDEARVGVGTRRSPVAAAPSTARSATGAATRVNIAPARGNRASASPPADQRMSLDRTGAEASGSTSPTSLALTPTAPTAPVADRAGNSLGPAIPVVGAASIGPAEVREGSAAGVAATLGGVSGALPSIGTIGGTSAAGGSVVINPKPGAGGAERAIPTASGVSFDSPGIARRAEPSSGIGNFGLAGDGSSQGSSPRAESAGLGDVRLPAPVGEPVAPTERFEQRAPEVREAVLEKMGGSAETEKAVAAALDWFSRHQEADGRWTGRRFDDRCGKCAGVAAFDADAAMTGMALLCYLGAGHTHMAEGPHREVVEKALVWLLSRQGADGDLRHRETMYGQTVATVALCEALAMTKDQRLADPARRAVGFVMRIAAKPRNQRSVDEDTSVLGWLVMTVESARRAGIDVPRDTFASAGKWLDYVSTPSAPGRYSYRKGESPSVAMTAEAMFVQQLLGRTRDEARMKQSAEFILRADPKWEDGAPTYSWYYATLALFEQQGDAWKRWNEALMPQLMAHQHKEGPASGSWDPQDEWSRMGGRIYQTAVCTLSLEVYYRYKPK